MQGGNSAHPHSTCLFGLCRRHGFWSMTVDHHKLDQVMTPITLLYHMCLSSLEPLALGAQLLIWQKSFIPFPSIHLSEAVCFQLERLVIHFHCHVSGTSTLQAMCNWVLRNCDYFSLPQDITLTHYIDDLCGLALEGKK